MVEERDMVGHPWEIIYKYLEMLAIGRKDDVEREKFSRLKKERLNSRGAIIEALEMVSKDTKNFKNNLKPPYIPC